MRSCPLVLFSLFGALSCSLCLLFSALRLSPAARHYFVSHPFVLLPAPVLVSPSLSSAARLFCPSSSISLSCSLPLSLSFSFSVLLPVSPLPYFSVLLPLQFPPLSLTLSCSLSLLFLPPPLSCSPMLGFLVFISLSCCPTQAFLPPSVSSSLSLGFASLCLSLASLALCSLSVLPRPSPCPCVSLAVRVLLPFLVFLSLAHVLLPSFLSLLSIPLSLLLLSPPLSCSLPLYSSRCPSVLLPVPSLLAIHLPVQMALLFICPLFLFPVSQPSFSLPLSLSSSPLLFFSLCSLFVWI